MKAFRIILWVILLVFLGGTKIWAYKPGPTIIRECPNCKTLLEQRTTISGNTLRARIWTDGKMIAPMLPDRPWLVKCPNCNHVLWINEAREIGRRHFRDKDKKWPEAAKPVLPDENDYFHVLSDNNLSFKKKFYIRQRAWWFANDAFRTNVDTRVVFSKPQKDNLQKLAAMLNENSPGQRILKAEIHRELEQYEECIKLLSVHFKNKYYNKVAALIRRLAAIKQNAVQEIPKEEKPKRS